MVAVTLGTTFLAPATDLSDVVTFGARVQELQRSTVGGVRQYAGGRRRLVTSAQQPRQFAVEAPYVPAATVAVLEARVGTLQLLRDVRGRDLYGAFMQIQVTDLLYGRADVTFTFEVTSDTAAV